MNLLNEIYPTMEHVPDGIDLFSNHPIKDAPMYRTPNPRPEDLADKSITQQQWNEALAGNDWLDAIDELLAADNSEQYLEDEAQMAALTAWREGKSDSTCSEIAVWLLAVMAVGGCVLGSWMGWL